MQEAPPRSTVKPSDEGAARVTRQFSRISGQRILLGVGDQTECTVYGRLHRHHIERDVSLAVALGLARLGVRTVVRTEGA